MVAADGKLSHTELRELTQVLLRSSLDTDEVNLDGVLDECLHGLHLQGDSPFNITLIHVVSSFVSDDPMIIGIDYVDFVEFLKMVLVKPWSDLLPPEARLAFPGLVAQLIEQQE